MIEKEMEDLIAEHPDEFFPRNKLHLIGRQGSFSGIGRYDLLFKDEYDNNILMELKAVSAKYHDAHQLAKYKDAFSERGEDKIILWLVATHIPKSVRDFLDNIGVEYSEIHDSEFRRVASKYDYTFNSEESRSLEMSTFTTYEVNTEENKIASRNTTNKYEQRKEQLRNSFPAAYNFLSAIDSNGVSGFKFGKAVNVHLYYKDGFYIYIKLNSSSIILCPFPNQKIKRDKKNKANLLFDQPLVNLIKTFNGWKDRWVIRIANDFEINRNAPEEFFLGLLKLIQNVHK